MKENIIIGIIATAIALGCAYAVKKFDSSPGEVARRNWIIECIEGGKREDDCHALYNLKKKNGKL